MSKRKPVVSKPHPMQPLELDARGVLRFRKNAIVDKLLEVSKAHGYGLNEIARESFSTEDHVQLAQLIGYSLDGFGSLSYVDDVTYATANAMAEGEANETETRLAVVTKALCDLQDALRGPMAALYGIHPDTLEGAIKK